MDKEQPRAAIQVAAAIIERDGRVLVARRAPGRHMAGHWEFPGGKLEPGETPQACIVRELAEELGVAVVAGEVIMESRHAYPGGEIELIAVAVRLEGGELRLTDHDALDWLEPHALTGIALAPADVPIAEALARRAAGAREQGLT